MNVIIAIAVSFIIIYIAKKLIFKNNWKTPKQAFVSEWRLILIENVNFYSSLNSDEKSRFEFKVQEFLLNCRITGIETNVNTKDKVLIASSAIIPIFEFQDWKYINLYEVLLYPGMFDEKFQTKGPDRNIMGMVGTGYMEGKMILSKAALYHGFANYSDKKNTAIHEFVHLIDKLDGSTDGIPELLLDKKYTIPWLNLINEKIEEIYQDKSDINPYGGTNRQEFFSVISEYFFERPKLLASKHPELYGLLEKIFKQDMAARSLNKKKLRIRRNDPCPCNSGLKFKKCCGSTHYKKSHQP